MKPYPTPPNVIQHFMQECEWLSRQPFDQKRAEFWIGYALKRLLWEPPKFKVSFNPVSNCLSVAFYDKEGESVFLKADPSVGFPGALGA